MSSAADWMVVAGFFLALTGLALRVVVMMRTSDANPSTSTQLVGSDMVRAHRAAHPSSRLPVAMWSAMSAGLILLIAGMLLEFR